MKYAIRLYRLLKPVGIYTSYLFTSMTVLYLAANELAGRRFSVSSGLLWGLFAFSLGSIGLQRLLLGTELTEGLPYSPRLVLYACGTVLWGWLCLRLSAAALAPAVVIGAGCCIFLELFNRYRAYMYNTLLEQYKKRKRL